MTRQQFSQLIQRRWEEACRKTPLEVHHRVHWDFGEYEHFQSPRGYGVTFFDGKQCRLLFAQKILEASPERADGVIRHEIGHVLDFLVPKTGLDAWGRSRGLALTHTVERRADQIAELIWNDPIRYDLLLFVQTTGKGVTPRPEHLGL